MDGKSLSALTKSFLKKFVSTNSIEGFHLWKKKDQICENGFHETENPTPSYGMKNSFENTFPLGKK